MNNTDVPGSKAVGASGQRGRHDDEDCPCRKNNALRSAENLGRKASGDGAPSTKVAVRRRFELLQNLIGGLLLLSAGVGTYLLATDASLWLLAVSHAIGLVMIVVIDAVLGLYSLAFPRSAYLPAIAAATLGFVLQLGDIFTAPQYNMTISYFAGYLFGLWAFDLLLGLQVAIVLVGLAARPHAQYLARRRTRQGKEVDYSRRGFVKALAGFAGLIGLGVLIGSVKLPASAGPSIQTTTTQSGGPKGAVANIANLQVGIPVYFEYPTGYPNALMKNADGSLTAVSTLCTHVCCQCSYYPAQKVFVCPCHGSVFDSAGKVVNGPATTDLPTVTLQVDNSGNVIPTGVKNPGPCQV
jgi:arsenite oxidase small subunit